MRNTMVLAALAFTSPALACQCIMLAPEGFRAQADVILRGKILSVDRTLAASGGPLKARIHVLKPVKGRTARIIEVKTASDPTSCGFKMVAGDVAEYLLMRRNAQYSTNLCLMMGSKTR